MMKKQMLLSCLAMAVSGACYAQTETFPDPIGPSPSDFGGTGLLQMPDARIAREGEFSLSYRDNDQYRFYATSIALFPWLEGTIRYTDVRTRKYSGNKDFSGDQSYKDKSFDFKSSGCGKSPHGCRSWLSANGILPELVCSTANILRLAKWRVRSI
jgi:Bacterial putative lipoprotein (DUF940).